MHAVWVTIPTVHVNGGWSGDLRLDPDENHDDANIAGMNTTRSHHMKYTSSTPELKCCPYLEPNMNSMICREYGDDAATLSGGRVEETMNVD